MSSLLATAAPWNSNDSASKKRTPAMAGTFRKTIKNRTNEGSDESVPANDAGTSADSTGIVELQKYNESKQSRVNEMLNRITSVAAQNDGSSLVDFTPIGTPYGNARKSDVAGSGSASNELLPKHGAVSDRGGPRGALSEERGGLFVPNESSLGKYTNYRSAHDPAQLLRTAGGGVAPYYAKMGIGKSVGTDDQQRLMEKINYMIRLLEEQQMEKTNNVAEEFLLYTLLGVFVIYIVDSFSRAGKYMR